MIRKRIDWRYWLLVAVVFALLEIAIACAAASVDAQVLGEGPVVAPTPLPTPISIDGDPMPRLYLDYYMPYVGK